MNRIDLTQLNGFRFGQRAAKFLQDANIDMIAALASFFGDKIIISGVEVAAGAVSDGWIIYNGEIIKFVGGAEGPDVVIQEQTEDSKFADDILRPVYKIRTAKIGAPGTFPFADLQRIDKYIDFLAAFDALVAAFNAHNHDYNNLINIPGWKVVHAGSQNIGDLTATDFSVLVNIPDQGGVNYYVQLTVWANDNSYSNHNDIGWVLYDKQSNSFKISFREFFAAAQNLRVEFIIVKPQ